MLNTFLFNTGNFVIYTMCAFSAFIMGWLVIDSEAAEQTIRDKIKAFGYLFFALFLLFKGGFDFTEKVQSIIDLSLIVGVMMIFVGLYYTPTPQVIMHDTNKKKKKQADMVYEPRKWMAILLVMPGIITLLAAIGIMFDLGIAAIWMDYYEVVAMFYLMLSTILLWIKYFYGLQKQTKYELLGSVAILASFLLINMSTHILSGDLRFEQLTQQFGVLWILDKVLLLVGFALIFKHTSYFIRYRLKPQLLISLLTSALVIFFVVTITFLLILISDFNQNTLFNLKASNKAIQLSVVELRNDSILAAKALSSNEIVLSGVYAENHDLLDTPVQDILNTSGADFITITNEAGLSLYETNDTEIRGTNMSEDQLLVRALEGIPVNSIVTEEGVTAKKLVAKTYMPIVQNEVITGAVVVGYMIDNQLVDAIKKTTDLDVTIFAENQRVATTFTTEDGTSRLIGTLETNTDVTDTVITQGETYEGTIDVFNIEYLGIYTPIEDVDDNVIGMMFVGEPSQVVAAVAKQSIQDTLKIISFLILLSIFPMYYLAKRIAMRQLI